MSERLDRRDAVIAGVAAGGLLLLGGPASAAGEESSLAGEWFNGGKLDQPCAIFQHGRTLLLVNEKGDTATARITAANQLTILRGWSSEGLVGRIGDSGKRIFWKGGGAWSRT